MKKIEEIREWMAVCEKAGIADQIPEQLHVMDAYARLLESQLAKRADQTIRDAKAEAWEAAARFAIEWMKNPGGIDARFIAALREQGAAIRGRE